MQKTIEELVGVVKYNSCKGTTQEDSRYSNKSNTSDYQSGEQYNL